MTDQVQKQVILTANVPEDMSVYQSVKTKKHLAGKPDYLRIFTSVTKTLAKDKSINLTDLRVFLGLLDYVNFENVIDVSQQTLADDLNVPRTEVSKSVRKLIDKGYIENFAQRGKQNVYRINGYVAFKTKAKNLDELQKEFVPIKLT